MWAFSLSLHLPFSHAQMHTSTQTHTHTPKIFEREVHHKVNGSLHLHWLILKWSTNDWLMTGNSRNSSGSPSMTPLVSCIDNALKGKSVFFHSEPSLKSWCFNSGLGTEVWFPNCDGNSYSRRLWKTGMHPGSMLCPACRLCLLLPVTLACSTAAHRSRIRHRVWISGRWVDNRGWGWPLSPFVLN